MRVAIVEPFLGGSHQSWAEGLSQGSSHQMSIIAHEARFWKWRMQGGFVTLADETRRVVVGDGPFDVIVATSMLDLAGYLGALGAARGDAVIALYMHENQLTYPVSPRDRPDQTYAMTNWTSMVVADAVYFNSQFHLDSWFEAITVLLNRFPDHKQGYLLETVAAKSSVLPVGVDLGRLDRVEPVRSEPATVLWNHRWEYDKGVDDLVTAMAMLVDRGAPFEVIVTGEQVRSPDPTRDELEALLGDRLVHAGEVDDDRYVELITQADIVVSTARQEFFGISVTEAIYAGAFPLLPRALVYPERIPADLHALCLYDGLEGEGGLVERCIWAIEHRAEAADAARILRDVMAGFDWSVLGPVYDQELETLAAGRVGGAGAID